MLYTYKSHTHFPLQFHQISLSDILCACAVTDPGSLSTFSLHTTTRITAVPRAQPIKMAAAREEDVEDWVSYSFGKFSQVKFIEFVLSYRGSTSTRVTFCTSRQSTQHSGSDYLPSMVDSQSDSLEICNFCYYISTFPSIFSTDG